MSATIGGRGFRFCRNIKGFFPKNVTCLSEKNRVATITSISRIARARPFSLTSISFQVNKNVAEFENNQTQVSGDNSQIIEMDDPFVQEKEQCLLCRTKIPVSYKNVQLLSQFVSPNTGLVLDRKITRLCEKQQKRIEIEVATARQFGFMPYMYRETIFLKDPNLFDVKYTGNPDIGNVVSLPLSTSDFEEIATPSTETLIVNKTKKQSTRKGAKSKDKDKKKKKK